MVDKDEKVSKKSFSDYYDWGLEAQSDSKEVVGKVSISNSFKGIKYSFFRFLERLCGAAVAA